MSLELKLETERQEKPDWKQWIPVYGIIQIAQDTKRNKPTIMDGNRSRCILYGSAFYHGFFSTVATYSGIYALYTLAEKWM